MATSRYLNLRKLLQQEMTAFLADHCFYYVGRRGRSPWWLRRWGWKTDQVRLLIKYGSKVYIHFEVEVPPPPDSTICEHIGLTDLGALLNRNRRAFSFPTFSWGDRRFIRGIMDTMPLGMKWFSKFDTSRSCLENMYGPNVNPQSKGFRYRQEYLLNLPVEAADGCCLLNLEYHHPNAIINAMYDVYHHGPLPPPPE